MATYQINGLESWELQALVDFLMYRLPMDERRRLMASLPATYNKIVGRPVVRVVSTETGGTVVPPEED